MDLLLILLLLCLMGAVSWIAYEVGQSAGRRKATAAISSSLITTRRLNRELDRAYEELHILRRTNRRLAERSSVIPFKDPA